MIKFRRGLHEHGGTMINWIETTVAVDALKPYEKNPRIISAAREARLSRAKQRGAKTAPWNSIRSSSM